MKSILNFEIAHRLSDQILLKAGGSLEFEPPHLIKSIFGPSGCGKSSLLKILLGSIANSQSTIEFNNEYWQSANSQIFLPSFRRQIGFVPQKECLFRFKNIRENILYGIQNLTESEKLRRLEEAHELFQIGDLLERRCDQISGGQKQRVALARAIATHPRLLLLDEAFSALDAKARELLLPKLALWLEKMKIPTLVVSHDEQDVKLLKSKIYRFDDYKIKF